MFALRDCPNKGRENVDDVAALRGLDVSFEVQRRSRLVGVATTRRQDGGLAEGRRRARVGLMRSASPWLSAQMRAVWLAIVVFLIVGGWILLRWLGLLCEVGSSGTEMYCDGGWEASGLAFAGLVAFAIVIPAAAVVLRRRRLFWIALVAAIILAPLNFVLSAIFGSN